MFDFNVKTSGMTLSEREDVLKNYGLVSIGTQCFRSGDAWEYTKPVIVTVENQKIVTMFWNALYFLDEKTANIVTRQAHADYSCYQAGYR